MACLLGVERLPPLALTSANVGPLAMGVLNPVVVLPEGLVQNLHHQQLRDVLVHEFSHALRRDTVIGLLQRLAEVLFWPHPLVYLLNRELAEAREELCDNFVLRQADAADYAETLVLIAESYLPRRRLAMVALLERRGGLERRVAGLLDERRKRSTGLHGGVTAVLGAAFMAAALLGGGTRLLQAAPLGTAEEPGPAAIVRRPLTLDLSAYCPAKRFSRQALESFAGRQVIDGLPFDVRCQVFLYGKTPGERGTVYPEMLKGIRVGRMFDELHLIHHSNWPGVAGDAVAYIELNYAGGGKAIVPIRYGWQILDWFYLPSYEQETPTDPDTKVCWRHAPVQYKAPLRLFKSVLRNPAPEKVVETIDVVSARNLASYGLFAMTVADHDPARPVTPPSPAQPPWKFDSKIRLEVVDDATGKPLAGALIEPSLRVLEQGVVGEPFYTSAEGQGEIRYPVGDTSSLGFSVRKDGYDQAWLDWQGNVPETFTVRLRPVGSIASGSLLGTLGKWLSQPPSKPGSAAPAAARPPLEAAQP